MKIFKNLLVISITAFTLNSCSLLDGLMNPQVDTSLIPDVPPATPTPATPASSPVTIYNPCPSGCPATETSTSSMITNTFDASGNLISTVNSSNPTSTTDYTYDANGNLTSESNSTGGTVNSTTTYTYVAGKLDTVSSLLGGDTTYTYGTNGLVSAYATVGGTYPDSGTAVYDSQNRLVSVIGSSSTKNLTYDAYNRLSTISDGGSSFEFSYDINGRISTLVYSVGTMSITHSFTYDSNGNLVTKTETLDGYSLTINYTYNPGVTEGRPVFYSWYELRYLYGVNLGLM